MSKNNMYNVGEIVKLKSGGPDMSINKVLVNYSTKKFAGSYDCQWFAGKKLDSGTFPEESLVAVVSEA
jgi:uncharacterized protein YodC (DUF2158 family)|tara:strand:+ start:1972 stop:2175 length:204 start_codon:yes stop_codon:yes gene_type:complete